MLGLPGALVPWWCASGTEYRGQITFGGLPVPGVTVTAVRGSAHLATITDQQGLYSFPDLTDGKWTIEVEMTGFSTIKQDVVIGPAAPPGKWELKLLPLDQIKANVAPGFSPAPSHAGLKPGATKADASAGAAEAGQQQPQNGYA